MRSSIVPTPPWKCLYFSISAGESGMSTDVAGVRRRGAYGTLLIFAPASRAAEAGTGLSVGVAVGRGGGADTGERAGVDRAECGCGEVDDSVAVDTDAGDGCRDGERGGWGAGGGGMAGDTVRRCGGGGGWSVPTDVAGREEDVEGREAGAVFMLAGGGAGERVAV